MPTYNYACLDCQSAFKAHLSYSELDSAHPVCPECGSTHCERTLCSVNLGRGASSGGSTYEGSSSSGGCAGCSGGSCATCHH